MIKFSVRKPFTVLVAVVVVFALGFASLRSMTPELLPHIELPYIVCYTTYPGATPEKVEEEITRPLEASFSTLEGLKSIRSSSRENISVITLEFVEGADLDRATLDMLQKINQVRGSWDAMVGTPIMSKMNPNMLPVMVAAVEQKGSSTTQLTRLVDETLVNKLEGIDGVASLSVTGRLREQVNVVIRADKIAEINAKVSDAIIKEFEKRARDLKQKQYDLEDTLDELKYQSQRLADGADQLARKIGEGSTELSQSWSDLLIGLSDQKLLLIDLNQKLKDLIAEEEAARLLYGDPLPPPIQEQFDMAKAMLEDGISKLEAGINYVESLTGTLAEAQGLIDSTTISALYGLSSGAGQLAAAQAQISGALIQMEQGLSQLDAARDTAVEKADMSGALTMTMVSTILKAQNFSMPAGYVYEGDVEFLVRIGDQITTLEDLKNLVLIDPGIEGVDPIKLSDVADVFISNNLENIYAKINGNDGILLSFSKQSEYATTEVADSILAKFAELEKQYPGVKFTPLMNQGDYIYMVTSSITSDLLWGALFAIAILLLFLRDLRPTFITLCAIPISLVFALVAMYFTGVTINIISLSGLAIAVGRLVDDSVVVIENIFRLRSLGYSPIKSAVNGAGQVAGAIISSTLTTICVFLPIIFVEGLTRQLFTDFGLTFGFALLASLAVAMTLVPAVASGVFKKMEPKPHRWLDRMIRVYDRALVWALRFKPVVLIFAVVLLAVSVWAVWIKGFEYMPEGDSGQLIIDLTLPKELTQEEMRKIADDASARVLAVDGVDTVGTIAGSSSSVMSMFGSGGSRSSSNVSLQRTTMYVLLDGKANIKKLKKDIEDTLADVNITRYTISSSSMFGMGSLGGSGITITLYGDTADLLIRSSHIISDRLKDVKGIADYNDGLENATPELHFTIDREKAAQYGLTTAQVFQLVSAALSEQRTSTQVRWGANSYNVVIINEKVRDGTLTPDFIKNLELSVTKRDGTTEKVKLSEISTFTETQTLPSVQRRDQRRYLSLGMGAAEGYNITLVTQDVERALRGVNLPPGVTYEISGQRTTIMDAFLELGGMLLLGLLLVYLIMVAQFQSLKSPFIIMFTVPLAFTGGFLALLVTNMVLSVISVIGFVMLLGIIVSNGIVLVDYINRLRMAGTERVAAIREAAETRMRPILMTALATIFALLVMALGIGNGSEMMQPLAIVCIGGLLYGTVMTLFVVPIIYDLFNRKELRVVSAEDLAAIEDDTLIGTRKDDAARMLHVRSEGRAERQSIRQFEDT